MIYCNHEAIRRAYPNAVTIDDGTGAFDREGNKIELDQDLIDASAIEIATEFAAAELRRERNRLLAETDWVSLKYYDLGQPVPTEWTEYRQALRDLPANTEDPANPVWPTKPE